MTLKKSCLFNENLDALFSIHNQPSQFGASKVRAAEKDIIERSVF